jgi:hypothetical protein
MQTETIEGLRTKVDGDAFLEFAVRQLVRKGVDELDALRGVINTYGGKDEA